MNVLAATAVLFLSTVIGPGWLKSSMPPYLPVPHDAAVILNTGSTNAPGYRIVVQRSGAAEYVSASMRAKVHLSDVKVAKFFEDLEAGMPLSKLRAGACMKSASFGSSTFAWWRGQRSSDISCPLDPGSTALFSSTSAIIVELGLARGVPRTLPTNEPRRVVPEASATPSM